MVTEWRIQKRVEEQFNAFIQGFHELIPSDLINVFDERELEILIGGISEIDVDDWAKNTDYRGYDEKDPVIQNFWKASNPSVTIALALSNLFLCSVSAVGTRNKSLVCCNSQLVRPVFPSTDSRICREVMDLVASQLKNLVKRVSFPSRIHVSTVLTCRRTRRMMHLTRSCYGPSRRRLDSVKSRAGNQAVGKSRKDLMLSYRSEFAMWNTSSALLCYFVFLFFHPLVSSSVGRFLISCGYSWYLFFGYITGKNKKKIPILDKFECPPFWL